MTPKEKAEELMDSMLGYGDEYHHCTQYVAKKCALIAVDEILNILNIWSALHLKNSPQLIFWEEVKQEIEKL